MATKVAIVMAWGEKGRLSFLNLGISQWWSMRFTSRFHTPKQCGSSLHLSIAIG